jgi:hypothetical protein
VPFFFPHKRQLYPNALSLPLSLCSASGAAHRHGGSPAWAPSGAAKGAGVAGGAQARAGGDWAERAGSRRAGAGCGFRRRLRLRLGAADGERAGVGRRGSGACARASVRLGQAQDPGGRRWSKVARASGGVARLERRGRPGVHDARERGRCGSLRWLQLRACDGTGDGPASPSFVDCLVGLLTLELCTCRAVADRVLPLAADHCHALTSLLVYDGGISEAFTDSSNSMLLVFTLWTFAYRSTCTMIIFLPLEPSQFTAVWTPHITSPLVSRCAGTPPSFSLFLVPLQSRTTLL